MFCCGKFLETVNPVIYSNPVPLFDVKVLMWVVVTQLLGVRRCEISHLGLCQFK